MMRSSRLAVALVLAVGTNAAAFEQQEVGPGEIAPIARDYKTKIEAWTRHFFADPRGLRSAVVSDPVMIRDRTGRLIWLVCFDAANGKAVAPADAPRRYAFGFAHDYFSAPLERKGATLLGSDCDARPLAWRPFRETPRSGSGQAPSEPSRPTSAGRSRDARSSPRS